MVNKNKRRKKLLVKNKNKIDMVDIEVIGADKKSFERFAGSVSSPWRVFFLGLLRGAGFGLGALIGGAILLSLLTYIIGVLTNIPVFGAWLKGFVDNVVTNMK